MTDRYRTPVACAYDRLEGDAHTNTLRLWLIGSGEALAACQDGRTGYVVVGFRA
jgi:hypothetical protein